MSQRIGYIDFLRGIAIITVVMGHVIQYNFKGAAANTCFNFIYSFHMGFFFFISGVTAALSSKKLEWRSLVASVKKKATQLLIPFFVWGGAISIVISGSDIADIPNRIYTIIKYPSVDAPWFLMELFFIQLVFIFCCVVNTKSKKTYYLPLSLLLSIPVIIGLIFVKKHLIGSGYTWITPTYLLMFILGYLVNTIQLGERAIRIIAFLSFLVFVAIVPLFDFHMEGMIRKDVIKLIASTSFSICAFISVKLSYQSISNRVSNLVNCLGTNTLEIYVTHFFFVKVMSHQWIDTGEMNSIPLFFSIMIISIPIGLIVIRVSKALKHIPYLSLLLYGK